MLLSPEKLCNVQAKRMHISMCIQTTLRACPERKDAATALLEQLMSICAESEASSLVAQAISQALPGMSHGWTAPTLLPLQVCLGHVLQLIANLLNDIFVSAQ